MMNIQRLAIALAISILIALLVYPQAHADIHPGDFELQGWCITGPDPRMGTDHAFHAAVTGQVNASATINRAPDGADVKHVHLDDLIKDGFIPNVESTYGKSYIFSGYWVEQDGQKHFRAYVPKDEPYLEQVSCEKALSITADTKDGYLDVAPGGDAEQKRQNGMDGEGQTQSEKGEERGKE